MPLPIRKESFAAARSQRIAFDNFEADLRAGELRKNGTRIRLQAQPFRLLVLLLKNAGEVVTREEICRELWANNTFVDFEHGLATAVKKIREAIGDSAENPKYIETLPKRGYRFVGKVKLEISEVIPVAVREQPQELAIVSQQAPRRYRVWLVGPLGILAAAGVAILVVLLFRHPKSSDDFAPMSAVPFTSYPGVETAPSFSPDGSRIAFSWDNPGSNKSSGPQFDLYVKATGSETLLRLTNHPSRWISSAWSPDGTQIAFHRLSPDGSGIYLVPALGGPERKLVATQTPYEVAAPISWSPDGKWLAYSDTENGRPGDRIFLLNVHTLEVRKFPHDPSCNHEGNATFSHSGREIALLCVHSTSSFEYFIANLEGTSRRSMVTIHEWPVGIFWNGDDTSLILAKATSSGTEFDDLRILDRSVRKLAVRGGDWPAISGDGHKLAFSLAANHVNIWRRDLLHPTAPSEQLFTSTLQQNEARYSPDGMHVVFSSTRSGIWSVWLADPDGSNLVQILHDRPAGFPRWSPDSRKIVFEAEEPSGLYSVYIADISDRVPRKLRTNVKEVGRPFWSHNGKWIFFRGYEGVGHQLYRCPAEGGDATLLEAAEDPISPNESADGKVLYFPERNLNALVMMLELDRPNAKPKPVPEMPRIGVETQWALVPSGIYFVPQDSPRTVSFYEFATRRTRRVFTADRVLDDGLSISADGRQMLYAQLDENNSSVMVVNNFR
jgi:Tol biopolymer transport system component/DNA-binding winged helix-turn-helix (wHTH) protein